MGRPDADPETLQPQMEYDPNLETTTDVADEYSAQTFQNQEEQGQQYQMGAPGTDPQTQQPQFQPPQYPPQQPNQAYHPPQQPPQQPNQAYRPPPYPPHQPNQAYPPPPYPPHQPNQAYPPPQNMQYNPNPTYTNMPNQQPVQYPPKSPPTNQMYANVGPQVTPSQTGYAPNVSPQAFPQQAGMLPPASPYKPGGQPPAVAGFPVGPGGGDGWRSGLFDFMDDPMNALMTAFFPCLTFGQIAEIVDDGHTSCGTSGMLYGAIAFCIGMPCIMSCTYRTKLRSKFGLPEAPAPDWVTHFLCEWMAWKPGEEPDAAAASAGDDGTDEPKNDGLTMRS
ncbi:hypothetical protein V6N13_086186 [Hibiscus sabdariffa]